MYRSTSPVNAYLNASYPFELSTIKFSNKNVYCVSFPRAAVSLERKGLCLLLATFLSFQSSPGINKPGDRLESAPRHNTERPDLTYWTIISLQAISVSPNKIYWVILISLHSAPTASSIPFLTTDTGSKITHFIHKTWTLHNSHSRVKGAGFKEVSLKTGQTVDPDTVGHCGWLNTIFTSTVWDLLVSQRTLQLQSSAGSGQRGLRARRR